MKHVTVAIGCALLLAAPRVAHACGAAYPGGPVMCDYPQTQSTARPIARISTSYAFTSTTILFGDERRAELTRHALFGAIEIPLSPKVVTQFGAGGVAAGELVHGAARDTMGPGAAGFFGVAVRAIPERGSWPFLQLTATLSATHAITHGNGVRTDGSAAPESRARYTALDLRAGAIVGKSLGGGFTPYAVGRVFGGPIDWHYDDAHVRGTDLYKYQLGAGLSLALFERRFDLFAEGIALGERGVAFGAGTTFF